MSGGTIGGLFLVGMGVLLLAGQVLGGNVWHYLWPFFIVGFGMCFFAGMLIAGRQNDSGALAIPGSLFVILGLIFMYQVTFDHWASWAYVWALVAPAGVGVGLTVYGWWNRRPNLYQPGLILITIGVTIFVLLGGFFEVIFGLAGIYTPGRILWPLALILLGVLILFGSGLRWLGFWHLVERPTPISRATPSSSGNADPNNTLSTSS